MVIDVHGAANIRRMYPGATTSLPAASLGRRSWSAVCGAVVPRRKKASGSALPSAKQELAQQDHFAVKLVNNEIGRLCRKSSTRSSASVRA